jgi:F420-dependent oxidoreductase-like protein
VRIAIFIADTGGQGTTAVEVAATARWAEDAGFAGAWVPHLPWGLDALTAVAVAGAATSRIELGTAVVPTYPVHPMAMARTALSVNAAVGGRLALGLGPSHPSVIERMHGLAYDRPAAHTREYLTVLRQAFADTGSLEVDGEFFRFGSIFRVPGAREPGLLLAALAPLMLRVAGEVADGTVLWFADDHAVREHVVPRITAAAAAAGRPAPRIVSAMPIAVCDDEAVGRERAARAFAPYGDIPTYRRILDRGQSGGPGDVVFVGDERSLRDRLLRHAEAGVTEYLAAPFPVGDDREGSLRRTRDFLAGLAVEWNR